MGSTGDLVSNSLTGSGTLHDSLYGMKRATSVETTASGTSAVSASEDGCLVLGTDAGRGNKYVTRFRIDRNEQREHLTGEILQEECLPCIQLNNRNSCKKFSWALFTAEPFLLTLHLSAISFGAVKEGLALRNVAEDLHLTASCIETFVALQLVLTRVIIAWMDYKSLKKARLRVEYVHSTADLHNPQLKRALIVITVIGVMLIIGDITAFFLFYFLAHLGWTILTNNFCIAVISATSGILSSRMQTELAGISEDQHKAVVYEMVLLLTEMAWAEKPADQKKIYAKADRFCKALHDTDSFHKPDYISIPRESRPRTNLITELELQSFV